MRLNHPDYIKLVTEAYKKKCSTNELSPLLAKSTPARIRKECLNVYMGGCDKKDEHILRAFFGPSEHGKQFLQLIRDFETDRFKPLDNYLKGNTEKTDDTNLDLLAWLINFQHRPYSFDKNFQLTDEELSLIKNNEKKQTESAIDKNGLQVEKEEPETFLEKETEKVPSQIEEELKTPIMTNSKNDKAKKRSKRLVAIFLILIIWTGGMYAIWQQRGNQLIMGNANTGCMYWANDHYEKASCNEEAKGRLLLPLNEEKMKNFKRILKEDTITEKSIGVIYCISVDAKPEYYTTGGNHPIYITRNLKLLSRYMFDKHLRKKEAPGMDSLAEKNEAYK